LIEKRNLNGIIDSDFGVGGRLDAGFVGLMGNIKKLDNDKFVFSGASFESLAGLYNGCFQLKVSEDGVLEK
jgi:hypothetical protein